SRPTPLPIDTIPNLVPNLATAPPTQTLQGIAPRAEINAALEKIKAEEKSAPIEVKPPVLPESPLRLKTPTPAPKPAEPSPASTLPSWATKKHDEPAPSATIQGIPSIASAPPAAEPAKSFSKTAVLGSLSSADLALPPVESTAATSSGVAPPGPAQPLPVGKKTELLGSPSIADRLAAINSSSSMPGLP